MRVSRVALLAVAAVLSSGSAAAPSGATAPPGAAPVTVAPSCAVDLASSRTRLIGTGCPASAHNATATEQSTTPAADAPLPCAAVPALDDRCERWTSTVDRGESDFADGLGGSDLVASSPAGDMAYVLSLTDAAPGTATDYDPHVIAYDGATGATKWSTVLPTAGPYAGLTTIIASTDGAAVYVVTNGTGDSCETSSVISELDPVSGRLGWTRPVVAESGACADVRAAALDPTGSLLYVIGATSTTDGVSRFLVTAHDTRDGDAVWHDDYRSATDTGSMASALALSPDGQSLFVAGADIDASSGSNNFVSWPLVAYDAMTGRRDWAQTWAVPVPAISSPANPPAGVVVAPDGASAYVVGGAEGETLYDIYTLARATSDGALRWVSSYEGVRGTIKSSFDSVWYHRPLAISPDGKRLFIAGYSTSLHGVNLAMDFVAIALNAADGTQVWEVRHTADEWIHWVPSIAVHPDGGSVYLSGQARHFQLISGTYETFAYNAATGAQQWTARQNDGLSYWSGMALSPDGGRLFVTGSTVSYDKSQDGDGHDVMTLGYNTR